ncbi:MAG: hypothetical protein PVJ34_10070 [Anaerolineae bacterium]
MSATIAKSERRWALRWAAITVALALLPYLLAWLLAPDGSRYTGLLINHLDGESYYAKMQQGARGDWRFHLPFTPESHEGVLVYTLYLALGHLAAALHLPIPWVYHLARAAAGLFMLLVAYRFIAYFFERQPTRRVAFLLLAFSAGFGWLFAPLGIVLADLWVAEGFTFLSILVNAHFPLAIGLMLLIFSTVLDLEHVPLRPAHLARAGAAGLLLVVVQPFPMPVALAVLGVYLGLMALRRRRLPWGQILVTGVAAAAASPVLLYDLYVYRTNPALAAWSAQNVTASLPPWNYALAYGLVLILALPGAAIVLRRRRPTDLFMLSWVGSVGLLLYVPFALQRRFIIGLHVPLVLLAATGLEQAIRPRLAPRRRGLATRLIVAFSALTNLLVPLIAVAGAAAGEPSLVMDRDLAAACDWLGEHTAWTDTILAPVEAGHLIPAWAGNRVVYGHPFETIDAEAKKTEVEKFYDPETTDTERRALLQRYSVRYVLVLPPEYGGKPVELDLAPAWHQGEAVLYRVQDSP